MALPDPHERINAIIKRLQSERALHIDYEDLLVSDVDIHAPEAERICGTGFVIADPAPMQVMWRGRVGVAAFVAGAILGGMVCWGLMAAAS